MRLIDIDKVVSDYKGKNKSLQNVTWFELTDYEVKAIPVEWIKKWCNEHNRKSLEERLLKRYGVITMLEDWEKENAL